MSPSQVIIPFLVSFLIMTSLADGPTLPITCSASTPGWTQSLRLSRSWSMTMAPGFIGCMCHSA